MYFMDRKPILQYVLNRLGSISKLFCIFFGGEGGENGLDSEEN